MTSSNPYYSNNITYTTGKYSGNFEYGSVSGINNLKKEADTCKLNVGKDTATKNRPSKITLRQFGIHLPTGAEVNSITVEYAHRKVKGNNQSKAPNILAPTISLLGWGSGKNPQKTGVAPTTTMKKRSVTFNVTPSKEFVENANFGVHINYPKNKNDASGYVELQYIRVIVNYTAPKYQISMTAVGNNVNVGETNNIVLSIGNLNGTKHKPVIPVTLDSGCTFDKVSEGNVSSNNNNVLWNTRVSKTLLGDNAIFSVYCSTSGTKNISMEFILNGITYRASCSFTVNPPSSPEQPVTEDSTNIDVNIETQREDYVRVTKGETIILTAPPTPGVIFFDELSFVEGLSVEISLDSDFSTLISKNRTENNRDVYRITHGLTFYEWPIYVRINETGVTNIIYQVYDNLANIVSNVYSDIYYLVIPLESELTPPSMIIGGLTSEELTRLGDEEIYIVSSTLKEVTSDNYVRDWRKNFRIGVFNNRVEDNLISIVDVLDFTIIDYVSEQYSIPVRAYGVPVKLSDDFKSEINDLNCCEISSDVPVKVAYDIGYSELVSLVINSSPQAVSLNDVDLSDFYLVEESGEKQVSLSLVYKSDDEEYSVELKVDFDSQTVTIVRNEYDPTDYSNLTIDEIFNNTLYWSNALSSPNSFEEKTVEFNYNAGYPLYILITGDYLEANSEDYISFTAPLLYEFGTLVTDDIIFPEKFTDIIETDEVCTLEIPSGKSSNPFVLYDFNIGDVFATGDDLAIRGLIFSMDIDYTDELILQAKLVSDKGKEGTRSFILDSFDSTDDPENKIINIGGDFELWGFKISEMVNLDEWHLIVTVENPYTTDDGIGTLMFSNSLLTFYYLNIEDELVTVKINGEDSRHYGMFIQNFNPHEGVKSEVKYYDIEGTDFNDAYRMNIDKKEIDLEFSVFGCNIQETTALLKEIAKLLVNKRDKMNRPIPNRIESSDHPGEHWDYILEDTIDSDVESADYNSKVKLTVPDGTSWSNEDTSTSYNGYNDSIVGVNPVIDVSPTKGLVELTELHTGQYFKLNYDYIEGDVLIIDCVERTVTLKRYDETLEKIIDTDISQSADYNVDWFILPVGEFAFDSNNSCSRCVITFTQRG